MKITFLILLLFILGCSSNSENQETSKKSEQEVKEVSDKEVESEETKLTRLLKAIQNNVKDPNVFIDHVRFVISPDCAYLMMLEEEKEFYEEADFKKHYSKIFSEEVIAKIQTLTIKDLDINRDESGKMIGFHIMLQFKNKVEGVDFEDEWGLGLDFLIEEDTYTLFCMQGAG